MNISSIPGNADYQSTSITFTPERRRAISNGIEEARIRRNLELAKRMASEQRLSEMGQGLKRGVLWLGNKVVKGLKSLTTRIY